MDAVSYLIARGEANDVRVASTAGKMNAWQPPLITSAIQRMPAGSIVAAAFDNDKASDQLTEELHAIVAGVGRSDLEFKDDRPLDRGSDWNQVLVHRILCKKEVLLSRPAHG